MVKKYIVDLSFEERVQLEKFMTTGRHAANQITRAQILLKADCNQPGGSWLDKDIAAALFCRSDNGGAGTSSICWVGIKGFIGAATGWRSQATL